MPRQKANRVQFSIRIDKEMKGWLELLATLRGFASLNDYIEDLGKRDLDSIDEQTRQQILTLQQKLQRKKEEQPRRFSPSTR